MAVTASAEAQMQILDVQAIDTKIMQLKHKHANFPEHAMVKDLEVALGSLDLQIVAAQTQCSDLEVLVRKAENDVEQVVMRTKRDQERLDSGSVTSSKDLESLQHEIASLGVRQRELEDAELEVLERLEEAQKILAQLQSSHAQTSVELDQTRDQLASKTSDIDNQISECEAQRSQAVNGLPQDFLDLYNKVRTDLGGVGAAMLHRAQCQGCHIALDASELNRIRSLASDVVVRCEQCRRILVRTAESGL